MSIEDLLTGFSTYNNVIREVANEFESVLIDDESKIPGVGIHFVDSVHFTDLGSRAMADRVVEGLVSSRKFDALVESVRSD